MFVIDILRATTTMCAALHHGARALIPVASTEEALRLAQTIGSDDVLLAGEQNCVRIPGFHLGNSPLEMTETAVRGKTLIMTTTNGTKALLACQGRPPCIPPARPTSRSRRRRRGRRWSATATCWSYAPDGMAPSRWMTPTAPAGWSRRAGRPQAAARPQRCGDRRLDLVRRYGDRWERPLTYSRAGRELIRLGFRDDIRDAARLDAYPVWPHFHERRVTLAPVPV